MLPVEMLEGEGQLARPMRFRSMPRFSGCRGTTFAGRRARWTPRRWHVVLALALAASAVMGLCWQFLPQVYAFVSDPVRVQSFCDEHALLSRLGLVGLNLLQIVLAVLPGEPIELASGYAFGFVEGTLLCLVASAAGSAMVFLAVRRWGRPLVELLFGRGEPVRFSWLMRSERLEPLMFAVFLIPGTPKDFLTYFTGLTTMRLRSVMLIATLGRIPSIVTSTIAAAALGSGDYTVAIASFVAAGLLICAGGVAYKMVERRHG